MQTDIESICRAMCDADSELSAIAHSRPADKMTCGEITRRLRGAPERLKSFLEVLKEACEEIMAEAMVDISVAPKDSVAWGSADGRFEAAKKLRIWVEENQ